MKFFRCLLGGSISTIELSTSIRLTQTTMWALSVISPRTIVTRLLISTVKTQSTTPTPRQTPTTVSYRSSTK